MTVARFLVGLMLVVLWAVPATSRAGATHLGPGATVEVIRESADGFDLRVTLPVPVRETLSLGTGERFSRLSLPGFQEVSEPGFPALPIRGFLFALPPGKTARVETELVRSERFSDLPPLPAPTPSMTPGEAFPTPVAEFLPDPGAYQSTSLEPSRWAELGPDHGWRFLRVQTVNVTPVRAAPANGSYEAARELIVRVRFEGGAASPKDVFPVTEDRAEVEAMADHLLINAQSARSFRYRPRRTSAVMPAAGADVQLRLRIGGTGLVRLSYDDLATGGFPAGQPVEAVRVEERGFNERESDPYRIVSIPRLVEDTDQDGTFNAGDYLVFYGFNFEDRYNPIVADARFSYFNTYWVTTGEGTEFFSRPEPPAGSYASVTNTPAVVHLEEENFYINFPPEVGAFLPAATSVYWLGPFAVDGDFRTTFSTPGVDPNGAFTASAYWQGAFLVGPSALHRVSLEINSSRILDSRQFNGTQTLNWTSEALASADFLTGDVPNELYVVGRGQTDDTIGNGAYFDFFELVYDRLLIADNNELVWNTGNHTGDLEFVVGGFTSPDVTVFDITNPVAPVVVGASVEDDGGGHRVRVRLPRVNDRHTYHACVLSEHDGLPPSPYALPPDLAEPGSGSEFIRSAPARDLIAEGESSDYIFLTHPEFEEAFAPLIAHRRELGHRVLVCDVFEVYDQFAGGNKTPWAIQRMVNLAFRTWSEPPTFLTLAADASEDYRNDTSNADPDWVPTMMHMASVPGALQIRELASTDTWFVSAAGPGDNFLDIFPDLFVGRLPVGSVAEATALSEKIINYEDMDPTDDWRNRGLFIADDAYSTSITASSFYCWKSIEQDFERATRQICETLIPETGNQTEFECTMFLMSALMDSVPALGRNPGASDCPVNDKGQTLLLDTQDYVRDNLTPAVLQEMSEGSLIVSFTGHANKNQMTTEGMLVHRPRFSSSSRDMDRVNNIGKPFVFEGFACHLNEFEHVTEGRNGESIGEVLLLAPNRGSIASIASTGYEWAHLNRQAQLGITAPLFWDLPRDPKTGRPTRLIGPATTTGLLTLAIESGGQPSLLNLLRTYALLGDPALRVDFAAPHFEVQVDDEAFEPGTPLTASSLDDTLAVSVSISDDTDVSTIRVLDGERVLEAAEITVENPTADDPGRQVFELSFKIALRLATYAVTVEATDWNERLNSVSLPVVFGSEFFSSPTCFADAAHGDSRRMTPGGANRIEANEALRAGVVSPVPLVEESFALLLDGSPISGIAVTPVDEDGFEWQLDAVETWPEGDHELAVRASSGGQTVERSISFSVSSEPLNLASRPFCYPNPVEREGAALFYELTRGARQGEVTIFTVSGRRVLRRSADCNAGKNRFSWDLQDDGGDEVANGVYLLVLELTGFEGENVRHMERIAVTR